MKDISAAEELKLKAVEAEEAYNKALAEAKAETLRISGATKAAIQVELDAALAKADEQIAVKTAESKTLIAEIRDNAKDSVTAVAKDTAKELVAAFGGKADAKTLTAAINARLKG
jgi:F-type H+-transporting ATPase subunit b